MKHMFMQNSPAQSYIPITYPHELKGFIMFSLEGRLLN